MRTCDILLAAYNGERFGPALLESLLSQTFQDFQLIVRDDGSNDGTLQMLQDYAPRFGGRMKILTCGSPTGSAKGNFSILINQSESEYIMFADIDDVWLPTKVDDTIRLLREAEAECEEDTPIYVFTDVTPVNTDLVPVQDSYWKYKKIDPRAGQNLHQSLICPVMLGCASGMNRALARLVAPVPATVTGHDWWALLIALAFGEVRYSDKRNLLYRLHGGNASKPKRVSLVSYALALNQFGLIRHGLNRRIEQAQAVLDRFESQMSPDKVQIIKNFVAIKNQGFLMRRYSWIRGGYFYSDVPRNIAMLLGM